MRSIVKRSGNGAHAMVPVDFVGQKVVVVSEMLFDNLVGKTLGKSFRGKHEE